MVVNIEQEYSNHIANGWEKFSDVTSDIFKVQQHPERTYNAISRLSIKFLRDKLKNLEIPDSSHP
ncbi:MAG: hypothetical protein ACYS21_04185 [Planctomycetota bacterium]|jgi:hypothetical protein